MRNDFDKLPDKIRIDPKGGSHYHIGDCHMVSDPAYHYVEVPKEILPNLRTSRNRRFEPCACVMKILKGV